MFRMLAITAVLAAASFDGAPGCTCGGSPAPEPPACDSPRVTCAGVCVDTRTDASHCGACGTVCPRGQSCIGGSCVVPDAGCGSCVAPDAGCGDTQSDLHNCGACGHECPASSLCLAGVCECLGDLFSCSDACVDLMTDRGNCGACAVRCCPSAFGCVNGTCIGEGPAGTTLCGDCTCRGADCSGCTCRVVDLSTSTADCGACDHPCAAGRTCNAGVCAPP